MSNDTSQPLPSPWNEFLAELDSMLTEPVILHCIGGFVLCYFYGLARSTGDIDYWAAIPPNLNLIEAAGEGSPLAKKHQVRLHHVAVNTMPEDYDMRLTKMAAGQSKHLKLFVPDAYDCILSKLERNQSKDRDDSDYLFRSNGLNGQELRARYEKELRPYLANESRHDTTLTLWIDIFESK